MKMVPVVNQLDRHSRESNLNVVIEALSNSLQDWEGTGFQNRIVAALEALREIPRGRA